jgi:hypothetical protein
VGEPLDLTGLAVTGHYDGGETRAEDLSAAGLSGFDSSAGGSRTVTVAIGGKSATFTVTVKTLAQRIADAAGTAAVLPLYADESLAPVTLSANTAITLAGEGTERVVQLASKGSLFTVPSGASLTLDSSVTLKGITAGVDGELSDNTDPLVIVYGTLTMKVGAAITGNTRSNSGGGVMVLSGGSFTMEGGTVSNNSAGYGGGGVYLGSSGSFTMEDGTISGNKPPSDGPPGVKTIWTGLVKIYTLLDYRALFDFMGQV